MSKPYGRATCVVLLGATAACSSGDDRARAESATAADTAVTASAPASAPAAGDTDSLAEGDVRIVSTNGGIDLALIGDSISSGLSPQALRTVRQETDTSSVAGTGLGAQIERAVKGTVQGAIGKRVGFPISDVREVRYDGETLVFDWVGEPRKLFENTKIDGKPLLASFAPDDARRFAAAVNARKGKPRHL
ncbi:MAG TPA: hypothetical protein VFS59_11590 [Gemmatimonadaceae bacterium]|nr:hypothetical protein [Gemmatimonadaceae bacterium]